jgi:hypothetical protein
MLGLSSWIAAPPKAAARDDGQNEWRPWRLGVSLQRRPTGRTPVRRTRANVPELGAGHAKIDAAHPITAPNDWNQNGCASRRNSSSRP